MSERDQPERESGTNEREPDAAPEPERPPTVQEKAGVSPNQVEDPPKAEGNRDEAEEK